MYQYCYYTPKSIRSGPVERKEFASLDEAFAAAYDDLCDDLVVFSCIIGPLGNPIALRSRDVVEWYNAKEELPRDATYKSTAR